MVSIEWKFADTDQRLQEAINCYSSEIGGAHECMGTPLIWDTGEYRFTVTPFHWGGSISSKHLHLDVFARSGDEFMRVGEISPTTYLPDFLMFYLWKYGVHPREYIDSLLHSPFDRYAAHKFGEKPAGFELLDVVYRSFRKLAEGYKMLEKPVVAVKIGGSALDAEADEPNRRIISSITSEISNLSEQFGILVVPGGGPRHDYSKVMRRKYDMGNLTEEAADAMSRANAREIARVFGNRAEFLEPSEYPSALNLFSEGKVAVFHRAPQHLLAMNGLSPSDSDAQTIALADLFNASTAVFVKRTDGVYLTDPRQGSRESGEAYAERTRNNRKLGIVTAQGLLDELTLEGERISRVGSDDLMGEHVIENSGLSCLQKANRTERVIIMSVDRPELLRFAAHGQPLPEYSIITK